MHCIFNKNKICHSTMCILRNFNKALVHVDNCDNYLVNEYIQLNQLNNRQVLIEERK